MKLSVIVITHPAYEIYLQDALKSLRNQTQHELILVHNEDKTLAAACNEGIARSSGEYIVRVDADDFIDPQLLGVERDYLDKHPDIDCVWCDYWTTKEVRKNVFEIDYHENTELEHACAAMYRRHVWESLKYDESLKYQESYDFWQRFRLAGYRAERIPQGLYFYRRGHESMSTNPERDKVRMELRKKYAH